MVVEFHQIKKNTPKKANGGLAWTKRQLK